MDMYEVFEFLKKCGVYYLATVENDRPRVRPFGALDIRLRTELQQLLEDLWCEEGASRRTIVFITHDIHEAVLLADRVLYMVPGEIRADIDVPISRPRMSLCDCENDKLCAIRRELKELF
jgi:ABC-type nitrate/sulfonate/bicarbonate transport system ATPase subunit